MKLNNTNLKSLLKELKLNENKISMIFGIVIIVLVVIFGIKYLMPQKTGKVPESFKGSTENLEVVSQKYTVQEGDSLWKIAEKQYGSGFKYVDIAKRNNINNASSINVGEVLEIEEAKPVLPTLNNTTIINNIGQITDSSYVVQKGDSLWKIAIRAYGDGYKWVEIARENKLVNPSLIHPGNTLIIPR